MKQPINDTNKHKYDLFRRVDDLLNTDYKNHTDEEFQKCLDEIPKINEQLYRRPKYMSEDEFYKDIAWANEVITTAVINKRSGI